MDPKANLDEQLSIARAVVDGTVPMTGDAIDRLSELVIALHEWRKVGGFDPYAGPTGVATYDDAIRVARDLLDPYEENRGTEYCRGQVALIADLWGEPGVFVDERMVKIEREIFDGA